MQSRTSDFFNLRLPYSELSDASDFWKAVGGKDEAVIENWLYRPDKLESVEPPKKWMIRKKTFRNFSFSKTQLSQLEFSNCTFESCLFIGSVIFSCRFNDCQFINCNFYRAQFENCFIDPRSFSRCLNPSSHANIGVGLYQELLQNSRQQAQPEFTSESQYQFRRWKRYLGWDEIRNSDTSLLMSLPRIGMLFMAWLFEKTTGSGTRFINLAVTSAFMILALTIINYSCRSAFGLMLGDEPVQSVAEAFYFSTIVVTTLGFGDITPRSDLGRIVVSFQAILGFTTFALLVSMAFRRMAN